MNQLITSTGNNLRHLVLLFLLIPNISLGQIEICDNGIDDDGDLLIDLNDADCICQVIENISLISNPSFEEKNCCPDGVSQLECATDWIQASAATTDYLHTCNFSGQDIFPPPTPFPDGSGIMGFRDGRILFEEANPFWKEYAGACLLSPMLADSIYRFEFDIGFVNSLKSPPINISFFGTENCAFLPFGGSDSEFGCPSNSPNWEKLASIEVSGAPNYNWVHASLMITPNVNISAVAIGPDCPATLDNVNNYYFFDNLLLTSLNSFDLQISVTGQPCDSNFKLSVPDNVAFSYQWYLEGVALDGEIFSEIQQIYGTGFYQVRIIDDNSCRVSTNFEHIVPFIQTSAFGSICEGESYPFGDLNITEAGFYIDTFPSFQGCDSIVALELTSIGSQFETVEATILEGTKYEIAGQQFTQPGSYPLTLTSFQGCDSLVVLELSTFSVFIPNIFSPNQDGFNDVFSPNAALGIIESVDIIVFDRWGSQVYRGPAWSDKNANQGVYVYTMLITFTNGDSHRLSGDVMVIK